MRGNGLNAAASEFENWVYDTSAQKKLAKGAGKRRMEKAVKEEAERLIRDFGENAHQELRERLASARRRRHGRLEQFLEKVAQEIERRSKRSQPSVRQTAKKERQNSR